MARRSTGHRLPSHRSAGVSAAQTYMPAIQPTNTYFQGTLASIEAGHRVLGDVEQPGDRPGEPDSRYPPDPLDAREATSRFILP